MEDPVVKHNRRSTRVQVKACRKWGVLLGREYLHDLCPLHFKEEYGYEPEERYGVSR